MCRGVLATERRAREAIVWAHANCGSPMYPCRRVDPGTTKLRPQVSAGCIVADNGPTRFVSIALKAVLGARLRCRHSLGARARQRGQPAGTTQDQRSSPRAVRCGWDFVVSSPAARLWLMVPIARQRAPSKMSALPPSHTPGSAIQGIAPATTPPRTASSASSRAAAPPMQSPIQLPDVLSIVTPCTIRYFCLYPEAYRARGTVDYPPPVPSGLARSGPRSAVNLAPG